MREYGSCMPDLRHSINSSVCLNWKSHRLATCFLWELTGERLWGVAGSGAACRSLCKRATNYGQRAEISFGFYSDVLLHSPTIWNGKALQSDSHEIGHRMGIRSLISWVTSLWIHQTDAVIFFLSAFWQKQHGNRIRNVWINEGQ